MFKALCWPSSSGGVGGSGDWDDEGRRSDNEYESYEDFSDPDEGDCSGHRGVQIRRMEQLRYNYLFSLTQEGLLGSEFNLNYIMEPDLAPYFWASVHQYYQELIELFIISDGWALDDFLKAAESRRLHMVFRSAYTNKGVTELKAKHFRLVFHILLECAKFQWLAPWKTRNTFGSTVCVKRQIGGLYLIYFLLMKQPEPQVGVLSTEKQKMTICPDDSRVIRFFMSDMDKLEDAGCGSALKKEIKLIFLRLHREHLFQKTMLRDEYTLDAPVMQLIGVKSDSRLRYFGQLKDVRDKLLYMTYQGIGNTTFREMMSVANSWLDGKPDGKRRKPCHVKTEKEKVPPPQSAPSTEKKRPTFQTRLRERLNQQFMKFNDECIQSSIYDEHPTSSAKARTSSFRNVEEQKCGGGKVSGLERKENWTVGDLAALRSERDLAVIAFRLVEVLRFITPDNPMTTSRLVSEPGVDHKAEATINLHIGKHQAREEKRLESTSRLSTMSQKGNHRCVKTRYTKSWMDYMGSDTGQTESPEELLEKLKAHDVRLEGLNEEFMPREPEHTALCDTEEDEVYDFVDKSQRQLQQCFDENEERELDMKLLDNNRISTWTEGIDERFMDMPDLQTYWEDKGSVENDEEQAPILSPITTDPLADTDIMDTDGLEDHPLYAEEIGPCPSTGKNI